MALLGFPEKIVVRMATNFTSQPNSIIRLKKLSGQDIWTMDGTDVVDINDNYLRLVPFSSGGKIGMRVWGTGGSTGSPYWTPTTGYTYGNSVTDTQDDYTFRELFLSGPGTTKNHWSYAAQFLYTTSPITFNPDVVTILEEWIAGKDMDVWPDKLMVTLGSAFVGGGFGLNENDKIVLKKVPTDRTEWTAAAQQPYGWSEDGTLDASPTNRIIFWPTNGNLPGFRARNYASVYLVSTGSTDWTWAFSARMSWNGTSVLTPQPYVAGDFFNYPPLPAWATDYTNSVGTSSYGGSWGGTSAMKYNPDVFKTMEFFGPDKTTYRYG